MQDYNKSLQRERKRRRAKIFLFSFIFLLFVFVGGAIYVAFFSDLLRFREVLITGSELISKKDLFKDEKLPYLFSDIKFQNILIADYSINRSIFKKTLTIVIKDREPYGIWCGVSGESGSSDGRIDVDKNNTTSSSEMADKPDDAAFSPASSDVVSAINYTNSNCFWFDKGGLLFARAPSTEGTLVKSLNETSSRNLSFGDHILPEEFLSNLFLIFEIIDGQKIDTIKFVLPDLKYQEVQVLLPNNKILYFSLRFNPNLTREALAELKPRIPNLKYIDFRSENKVFYK